MDLDHNPIAIGYQAGGILGLILGGFLADTWLGFAIVALSSAAGGILLGWVADSILTQVADRRGG